MRHSKLTFTGLLLFLFIFSSVNISFTLAGWDTDPLGDSDLAMCDITRLDVDPDFMKITVAETIVMNESLSGLFGIGLDYNVWIETSQYDNTADLTFSTDTYEYVAHLSCKWISDAWVNESYLLATRYYLTSDGSSKTEGTFYWNIGTNSWQATIPDQDIAIISGTTITWDTEGALFREQPLGTGYVVQGIASASYLMALKDVGPNNHLVDEFDNMCVPPSTSSTTPTNPLPSIGFLFSIVFLALGISGIMQIRKRRR